MVPPRCGVAPTAAAVVPRYCCGTVLLLWPPGVDRRAPVSTHDAELQPLHPQHHHRLPFCCYQAVVMTVTTCELFLHLPDLSPSSPGPRPCSVMWFISAGCETSDSLFVGV